VHVSARACACAPFSITAVFYGACRIRLKATTRHKNAQGRRQSHSPWHAKASPTSTLHKHHASTLVSRLRLLLPTPSRTSTTANTVVVKVFGKDAVQPFLFCLSARRVKYGYVARGQEERDESGMRDVRSSVASMHYYLGAADRSRTFRNFATSEQCGQAQRWPTVETSNAVLWPFIALVWSALASRTR